MMEFNFEQKLNILINICLLITFVFCIILIIDELYNIIRFSFNYTYLYNYGAYTEKFNKDKTIEIETRRFNIYNNIDKFVLKKDIYNKSYLNYLVVISITLITLLFVVSYGLYFYETFILDKAECYPFYESNYYPQMSIIKRIVYCLNFLKPLNQYIPNCTLNYIVLLFITLIVPITYIIKLLFNYDVKSSIINYLYMIVYLLLTVYYTFKLFMELSNDATGLSNSVKIQRMINYLVFTILFISSRSIYNYVYDKYADSNLMTTIDETSFYDIYKQIEPVKPKPIDKPKLNGEDLLKTFTYSSGETGDRNYLKKKQMVDDYYAQMKIYDQSMEIYNEKYNIYKQSKVKLPQKLSIIDVPYGMIGFNDKFILYLHFSIIVVFCLDYYYQNEKINYNCLIYLVCVLIIITLMNCVVYYNTYLNKYIIYEPMAQYKSDISVANTKLNLLLTDNDGDGFYNALTNNINTLNTNDLSDYNNPSYKNKSTIIQEIKNIAYVPSTYNFTSVSDINTDILANNNNLIDTTSSIKNVKLTGNYELCYSNLNLVTGKDSYTHFVNNISSLQINDNKQSVKLIKYINFYYDNQYITLQTNSTIYYMTLYYVIKYLITFWNQYYMDVIYKRSSSSTKNEANTSVLISKLQELNEKILSNYDITNLIPSDFITSDDLTGVDTSNAYNTRIINMSNELVGLNLTSLSLTPTNLDQYATNTSNYATSLSNIYYSNIFNCQSIEYNHYSNLIIPPYTPDSTATPKLSSATLIVCPSNNQANTNIANSKITGYCKLPNHIIDNNNNEYSIKINYDSFFTSSDNNLYLIEPNINDSSNSKILNSLNIVENSKPIINQTLSGNDGYINSLVDHINYTKSTFEAPSDNVYLPYSVYSTPNLNTNSDDYLKLKQIVYDVIVNSLTNVINSGITNDTPNLYNKFQVVSNPNQNIILNNKFNTNNYNINTITNDIANSFLNITVNSTNTITDYSSFVVLVYNIIATDPNKINNLIDTINYLIYMNEPDLYSPGTYDYVNKNKDILNNSIYFDKANIISFNNNIKDSIVESIYNNNSLITLYNKNIHVIHLILKLFSNLLNFIKSEGFVNIDPSLCSKIQSQTLNDNISLIEGFITKNFTEITSSANKDTSVTDKIPTVPLYNSSTSDYFQKISANVSHFLNITLFLLENLSDMNSDDKNTVITNYNFFNNNIFTDKDLIKRDLSIDCNYYNQYFNMNNKDITQMKNNINNVSYNFILLITAFSVILLEPMLIIKS